MDIALLGTAFLATVALIVLRFTTVLRQILDSQAMDRRERARELDEAHTAAFSNAMTALESIQTRVTESQTDLLNRTVDMVAGPQQASTTNQPADDPRRDNRPAWQPDDDWDYSGIALDPTDDLMPDPPLEPEGNEHRAIMVPPGQGLI